MMEAKEEILLERMLEELRVQSALLRDLQRRLEAMEASMAGGLSGDKGAIEKDRGI